MAATFQKWGTIVLFGFIFMGVMLHAKQFSTAAGTIDKGINATGLVLEGQ